MGYPAEVEQLRYDPRFAIRGVWYDRQLEILLKTDEYSNILAAWKGFRRLSNQEIRELYPNKHIRFDEERIQVWTTVFHLPEIYLLAGVIDILNRTVTKLPNNAGYCMGESRHLTYHAVQADIRTATDYVHESVSLILVGTSHSRVY